MIDIGIYPLNTGRFLLDTDPVAVQAKMSSQHEAFEHVDEQIAFQLLLSGDVTASFNAQPASGLVLLGTAGRISIEAPFAGNIPQEIHVECGDVGMEYTGPPVDEIVE